MQLVGKPKLGLLATKAHTNAHLTGFRTHSTGFSSPHPCGKHGPEPTVWSPSSSIGLPMMESPGWVGTCVVVSVPGCGAGSAGDIRVRRKIGVQARNRNGPCNNSFIGDIQP